MVTMAEGIHLFPYRTQKLSLLTPMVLGRQRPGSVGSCQIIKTSNSWSFLMSKIIKIKLRLKIGFVAYGNLKMLLMAKEIHLFSLTFNRN